MMIRRFAVGSLIIVASCRTALMPASTERDVAEIRALEAERTTAYERLDTAWLSTRLSNDFVAVIAGGMRDKAGAIQAMLEHNPQMPIDSITRDSVRIRVYGNSAVVTALNRIHMRDMRTSPHARIIASNSSTHVWERMNRQWLLVSTQQTFFDQKRIPLSSP